MGFPVFTIVPTILLSEIVTGLVGGGFHNSFGNVEKRAIVYKTPFAICGAVLGAVFAVSVSRLWLKLYIGLMVLGMGILMLYKYVAGGESADRVHTWRLPVLGTIIGWNKACSGGGYGPLSTAGLSWCGLEPKKSVGTTTLSEGLVCIVALLVYLLKEEVIWNWGLAVPLIAGAVLATYPAAYTAHRMPKRKLGLAVAVFITALGANTLRVVLF